MSNTSPPFDSEKIGAMFAQLSQQDVEEFYLGYQYWNLQHQIEILQNQLNQTHRMIIENTERLQQVQPTAIELATLARLQSNGVSDVSLLDQMLERGELWLDRTMQRLDYLEQLDDFIRDDYTQWCQLALEGAYDWIDSVLDGDVPSAISTETTQTTKADLIVAMKQEELIEATEELFFQKISTEDELHVDEITLKRASITPSDLEEVVPSPDEMHNDVEEVIPSENAFESIEEPLSISDTSTSTQGQPSIQEQVEEATVAQTPIRTYTHVTQEYIPPKRPGLLKRFLGKIWGS